MFIFKYILIKVIFCLIKRLNDNIFSFGNIWLYDKFTGLFTHDLPVHWTRLPAAYTQACSYTTCLSIEHVFQIVAHLLRFNYILPFLLKRPLPFVVGLIHRYFIAVIHRPLLGLWMVYIVPRCHVSTIILTFHYHVV